MLDNCKVIAYTWCKITLYRAKMHRLQPANAAASLQACRLGKYPENAWQFYWDVFERK